MSYNLIIRLKKDYFTASIEWVLWDRETKKIAQQSVGLNDELKVFARAAHEVLVITPGLDVFITQVKMPKLSATKLAKAVVFALEEKLSEDVNLLHFAIGKQKKDGNICVAVISKQKMDGYKAFLKAEFGEVYSKIYSWIPEMLAIPWEAESYSVLVEQDTVLLRTDAQLGFLLETDTLLPTLDLILAQNSEQPKLIKAYIRETENLPIGDAVKDIPVEKIRFDVTAIDLMAETLEKPLWPINLMQGTYGTRQISKALEKLFWIGYGLICIWLIATTVFGLAQYMLLTQEKNAQHKELNLLYAIIHPNTALPSDPKACLQKELSNLRLNVSGTTFLRLLNALGQEIKSFPDIETKSLKYTKNRVEINFDVKSLESVEALKKRLEMQGYKIKISNATRGSTGLIGVTMTAEEIH